MKYIDAEKLRSVLQNTINSMKEKDAKGERYDAFLNGKLSICEELLGCIDSLQQEYVDMGEVSDGYHTFNELYYYRMLYNAAFFNLLPKGWVHKSKRHHTGEECFGGGWFIVMANLPTGQISNHYEIKDWDLFQVPEKEIADEWDGHTPQEAAERLHKYLQQEQPEPSNLVDVDAVREDFIAEVYRVLDADSTNDRANAIIDAFDSFPTVSQIQPEVDLEKEMDSYFNEHFSPCVDGTLISERTGMEIDGNDYDDIARHFYELGFNARKEDIK